MTEKEVAEEEVTFLQHIPEEETEPGTVGTAYCAGTTVDGYAITRDGRYYRKKLSTANKSAFLQLIGKLSLTKKIDLGIIEKLSLSLCN